MSAQQVANEAICIVLGSLIGVLLRVACQDLYQATLVKSSSATAPPSLAYGLIYITPDPLYLDFFSNILGCFGMGVLFQYKTSLAFFTKYPQFYLGVGTGLLGSLTTFAAWSVEAATKMWHISAWHGLTALLAGWTSSFCAFLAGSHLHLPIATSCAVKPPPEGNDDPPPPWQSHIARLQVAVWILALTALVGCLLASILTTINTTAALACLGVPFGALARWRLSLYNARTPRFPAFTFLANVLGCIISISVQAVVLSTSPSETTMHYITAVLLTGFSGGMSTVSTFALEIHNMSPRDSWSYGVMTFLCTQLVLLAFDLSFSRLLPSIAVTTAS